MCYRRVYTEGTRTVVIELTRNLRSDAVFVCIAFDLRATYVEMGIGRACENS